MISRQATISRKHRNAASSRLAAAKRNGPQQGGGGDTTLGHGRFEVAGRCNARSMAVATAELIALRAAAAASCQSQANVGNGSAAVVLDMTSGRRQVSDASVVRTGSGSGFDQATGNVPQRPSIFDALLQLKAYEGGKASHVTLRDKGDTDVNYTTTAVGMPLTSISGASLHWMDRDAAGYQGDASEVTSAFSGHDGGDEMSAFSPVGFYVSDASSSLQSTRAAGVTFSTRFTVASSGQDMKLSDRTPAVTANDARNAHYNRQSAVLIGGGNGDCSFDVVWKAADKAANTMVVTIFLGMFTTIPLGMASIGVKHLEDCPVQPYIPVYLLVGGCFGLLKVLSLLWRQVRLRRSRTMDDVIDDDDDDYYEDAVGTSGQNGANAGGGAGNGGGGGVLMSRSSRFSDTVLSVFLVVWFVCGNCWVFGVRRPIYFRQQLLAPNNWCDRTVYVFAFVQIITCYVIAGLLALAAVLLVVCRRIIAASGSSRGGTSFWISDKS